MQKNIEKDIKHAKGWNNEELILDEDYSLFRDGITVSMIKSRQEDRREEYIDILGV